MSNQVNTTPTNVSSETNTSVESTGNPSPTEGMSEVEQAIASLDFEESNDNQSPGDNNENNQTTDNNSENENSTQENDEDKSTENSNSDKPKDSLSKSWAKLQQRERELQNNFNELKQTKIEVENYKQTLANAKHDPIKFLESAGISMEALTEHLLNGPKQVDPKDDAIAELQAFKQQVLQHEQQRQQQVHVQQYQNDLVSHLQQNADKYPLVQQLNLMDTVWDVVVTNAQQGNLVTPEQALSHVESYYSNLRQQLGTNSNPTQTQATQSTSVSSSSSDKTLTNNVVAQPSSPDREMSEEERIAKAIEYLNSQG